MGAPDLGGRVAVVTGGSRGIGRAVVAGLAAAGADVLACGRSTDTLAQLTRELMASRPPGSGEVVSVVADVRDAAAMDAVVARAVERFGGLDIVVNNAGVGLFGPLATQSIEAWREVIETNLLGVYHTCRAALPALRSRGGGWIINISSLAGRHPFAGASAYCASKAGLDALTEALMQEVRRDGIRVSSVAPGSVATRFADQTDGEAAAWKLQAGDVARSVVDLLAHDSRSLPSRVELRPLQPRK